MSPTRSPLTPACPATISFRPCAARAVSRYSALKRARRSQGPATTVPTNASRSRPGRRLRCPFRPAPTSQTTIDGATPSAVRHPASQATRQPRSLRRPQDDTRAQTATPAPARSGTPARNVPAATCHAATGSTPASNHRAALRRLTPLILAHSDSFTRASIADASDNLVRLTESPGQASSSQPSVCARVTIGAASLWTVRSANPCPQELSDLLGGLGCLGGAEQELIDVGQALPDL